MFAVLLADGALTGMRAMLAADLLAGHEQPIYAVWKKKGMAAASLAFAAFYLVLWAWGRGLLYPVRVLDLAITYLFLALVDGRCRIVPGSVLICFLLGQLLLATAEGGPELPVLFSGGLFAGVILIFTALSGGRMGMGDALLLGATAVTAGWMYALEILVTALVFSFFYSIWLILFRRLSMKTEIPFVPFLAAAVVFHIIRGIL